MLPPFPAYVQSLRKETRRLRVHNDQLRRVHTLQKQKADQLEKENTTLKKENEKLKKREQELLEELEKIKQERDNFKHMVFKAQRTCTDSPTHGVSGRNRGGQKGHRGCGRKRAEKVDRHTQVFLTSASYLRWLHQKAIMIS
jgi:hypothetical protein